MFTTDLIFKENDRVTKIWQLAHCNKALKKHRKIIIATNICKEVENLIKLTASLRTLAFLLFGVTKTFDIQTIEAEKFVNAVLQKLLSQNMTGALPGKQNMSMQSAKGVREGKASRGGVNDLLALNNQDDLLENGLDLDNLPTEVANNYKISDISESQLYTPGNIADIEMAKPIGAVNTPIIAAKSFEQDFEDEDFGPIDISEIEKCGSDHQVRNDHDDDDDSFELNPTDEESKDDEQNQKENEMPARQIVAIRKKKRRKLRHMRDETTELSIETLRSLIEDPRTMISNKYSIASEPTSRPWNARSIENLLQRPATETINPKLLALYSSAAIGGNLYQRFQMQPPDVPNVETGRAGEVNAMLTEIEHEDVEMEFHGENEDLDDSVSDGGLPATDGVENARKYDGLDTLHAHLAASNALLQITTAGGSHESSSTVETDSKVKIVRNLLKTHGTPADFLQMIKHFNRRQAAKAFHGMLKLAMMEEVQLDQKKPSATIIISAWRQ